MQEIQVREAKQSDIQAVSDLLSQTWHDTYAGIFTNKQISDLTRRWHNVDVLTRQQANPGILFLVAELDGTIAGHALAGMTADGIISLIRLYVLPQAQGHGLGKKLYQQVLAVFPKAKLMRLEVEPQNTKAVGFYQSLGFCKIGQTENCSGDSNIPAMIMEKSIADG